MSDDSPMDSKRNLLCPDCRTAFSISGETNAGCQNCGYVVDFFGSIPRLLPTSEKVALSGMEKTFAFPSLYNRLVDLKALLSGTIPHLGVQELVAGRHVLDVGCGPTLKAEHAEHAPDSAAGYTGIELSLPFLASAREENPSERFFFAQASINSIPFPDKSFDTTIVSFVIHHVPGDPAKVIEELKRVTRKHLVIYDHLRSDNPLFSLIQSVYWNTFDGGCNYMTRSEWQCALGSLNKTDETRNGPFGQVLRMILEIPD